MANEIASMVKQHVGTEFVNVEQALESVIREWVERLRRLDNEYCCQREQDVRDVGRRMTRYLAGSPPYTNESLPAGSVIVARELFPSEAIELANSGVIAIVSEYGGTYSHTAIIARSLRIPAITGITNVISQIRSGMRLLVDGEMGRVVIAPSPSDEVRFAQQKRDYDQHAQSIAVEERLPSVTCDGINILLRGNVGRPEEVAGVSEHNLAGVGLFRTEFLFLESHSRPGFDTQLKMYDQMASDLNGLPLVIRTFDFGGDILPPFILMNESEAYGSLHLRGLRFSLAEQHLLETQLRAIIYVAQATDVRILFPMVIGVDDFARALAAVDNVVEQFAVPKRPTIGAMIETPAALYALDEILELADFVVLGTNDLTQYMLAADRELAESTDDCTAMHPAVLRAIQQVVQASEKWQRPLCVCGEQAGDADFARLLVGLGVRELSVSTSRAAVVRQAIRELDSQWAGEMANRAIRCRKPSEVRELFAASTFCRATSDSIAHASYPGLAEKE
jgi:phosphoenolpyruvate-protein phosphotransferase